MSLKLQKILPQHALSQLLGWLADRRLVFLKNWVIKKYIKHYRVNMDEAEQPDYTQYPTFNDFFIRPIKKELRPFDPGSQSLISPVDGSVSEVGSIDRNRIIQAKKINYEVNNLLGGDPSLAAYFVDGRFATLYLAPKDYHRIHMPIAGRLLEMIHVPGELWSVSPETVEHVPNLFARNERVICLFETAAGLMSVVAVGAIIVGSIATAWHGIVTPPTAKIVRRFNYRDQSLRFSKGEEIGYFRLGSTVILLFQPNRIQWQDSLKSQAVIKMGQVIGDLI